MAYLLLLVIAGTAVQIARNRQARRCLRATLRSSLVYLNLADPDHGTLQLQVLLGARRARLVSVNGVTRVPSHFEVAVARSDRPVVAPVERLFLGDVADALTADAQANGWEMSAPPTFHVTYTDDARPGFPTVTAARAPRAERARHERPLAAVTGCATPDDISRTAAFTTPPTSAGTPDGRRPSQLRLRGTDGGDVLRVERRNGAVEIGRSDGCDVTLRDPAISGRHARLASGPRGWTIVDRASTNGTFVNGVPAATPTPIGPGDVVRFGADLSFLVEA